jgi:hypothetical protein
MSGGDRGSDRLILAFLGHYVRRYAVYGILAALGILTYGAATAGLVFLIKPIFGEVLLAGDGAPSLGGLISGAPAAGATRSATARPQAKAPAVPAAPREERLLDRWKRRLDLSEQLDSSYESSCCARSPTSPRASRSSASASG